MRNKYFVTGDKMLDIQKYLICIGREVVSYALIILMITGCEATKCYKNEAIGDRDGNVYYCDNEDTPECCQENGEFSCCESTSTKTVREQLILWGSLAAVVIVIALILCYFWKDIHCCKDDTPLKEKCCRCCKKKDDEDDLTPIPEPAEKKSYDLRSRSDSLDNFNTTFYRDTPVPAFNYKPKY